MLVTIPATMKRHNESSEDEREPKRAKIAHLSKEDPLLPPEILQKIAQYAFHEDFKTASRLLQSAKLFEADLSEENWKLFYIFRWHKKILGEDGDNYSNEEIISEIEQHLSVEPNDYVDKQFYENNAWKNRYKYRSQLENEGRKVSDEDLSGAELDLLSSCSFSFYKIDDEVNSSTKIEYSNLTKIEALIKREILALHAQEGTPDFDYDDEDQSTIEDVYHAIFILRTGAPVKIRLETLDGWERGTVAKKYVNTRVLAYNYKNQIWDIISAQYSNFAIDEDSMNYYNPYCTHFSKALFVEEKNETSDEKDYNGDVYRIICAAAEVSEEHIHSNTDRYVNLDAVTEEGEPIVSQKADEKTKKVDDESHVMGQGRCVTQNCTKKLVENWLATTPATMKRHNKSSEDKREPKRAKIDHLPKEDPLFPPEILQKIVQYACHQDVKAASRILRSAKLFEDVLSEEGWKLFYIFRWHRKILGEDGNNFSNEELLSEIEQHLSVEPNDYVDKQFYGENAWKNRYKYRAILESERRRVSDKILSTADLFTVKSHSFAVYKIDNDVDKRTKVQYSNLAKIEAFNKKEILDLMAKRRRTRFNYDDNDNSMIEKVYHAILIANTGAPVKVRLELLDGRHCGGGAQKMYANTRVLAYNYKNQIWDVISAQYCNYAVEEDEINYYKPYCTTFSNALFVEGVSVLTPGERKLYDDSYSKVHDSDLYLIICAAAQVEEQHIESNGSTTVDLDAVNEEPVGK